MKSIKKCIFFAVYLAINIESYSQDSIPSKVTVSESNEPVEYGYGPTEYQLPEVVITVDKANEILKKAIYNLKNKYIRNVPISYLWHGIEEEKNKEEIRESYALYSTELNKINLEKNEIPFDIRLIGLNHIFNNIQTAVMLKKGKFQYHPTRIDGLENEKQYKIVKKNSSNDSLIFLHCIPVQQISNSVDIIINKSDTVLLSIKVLPLTAIDKTKMKYKKILYLKHKILDKSTYISVKEKEEGYYFDTIYSKVSISFLFGKREELIEIETKSVALPDRKTDVSKKDKKLTSFSNQLFKLPATTIDRFWEEYCK
jgi:hypothetical protein